MLWVVEAWRGVASALVVWAHWAAPLGLPMGFTAFAFTGVDLFFVLSGFVFAPVLMQRPVPSLRAYALRRVLRELSGGLFPLRSTRRWRQRARWAVRTRHHRAAAYARHRPRPPTLRCPHRPGGPAGGLWHL